MISFNFLKSPAHRKIFAIALPMVLSNISAPLLGLVDTAVIGHLPESYYLAGVALGSMIISLLFWILVFLRMSTTGLVAQAYGESNAQKTQQLLVQSVLIALTLACILIVLQTPISMIAFHFVEGSEQVLQSAHQYFDIRIWSAPAALTNMVLLGWMLGMQNAKGPMFILIITNVTNILLSLLFVVLLNWGVSGVALASLISSYVALAFGLCFITRMLKSMNQQFQFKVLLKAALRLVAFKRFIGLNRDIFIRSLCLQVTFAFMTTQGAKLGDDVISANAVLMNFVLLSSFLMDGLAHAAEALVGKNLGRRSLKNLKESINLILFWASVISVFQLTFFYFLGPWIIDQITTIKSVRIEAARYLPWLMIVPITSMLGYVFDGIFIGMTRAKDMRNSMIFSLCVVYFPVWFIFADMGNDALWIAMNALLLSRGLSLLWIYRKLDREHKLIV